MFDEWRSAARNLSADRTLRQLAADCQRILSERGEANSAAIARQIIERYDALPQEHQGRFFELLAGDFSPEPTAVLERAQAYADNPAPEQLIALLRAVESPRQELFRRVNRTPGGTASIVRMRRALLSRLHAKPALRALEADLLHLLSSWFNPGFLSLRKVDWSAPAQLLELLIRYEAVHEIDGWDDLRRRLQPDRRCFAFFHPQLPDEPLIFVEVALLPAMPDAIAPLIDKSSPVLPPEKAKVAAFYSISNCQPGLKGVSLGNFLIKRVAEQLRGELPQLKTFCTLSPIPGLAAWLAKPGEPGELPGIKPAVADRAAGALAQLGDVGKLSATALTDAQREALEQLAAVYLVHRTPLAEGDPVARFHLDNGARLERINPGGDLSRKGQKQALGFMVNYLYDLDKIEANHEAFTQGTVVHSRAVSSLL